MGKVGPGTSLREIAFFVSDAIARAGGTVVLSGGGAATIYSEAAYQSRDLDFVIALWAPDSRRRVAPIAALGFRAERGMYVHDHSPYTLEFLPHPLAIDQEVLTQWSTLEENGRRLNILTPTDCVRDRLASFLYDNDFSGLEQALLVAAAQRESVDLHAVERWCRTQGERAKGDLFLHRLRERTARDL